MTHLQPPDRDGRLESFFAEALELDPGSRSAYLDEACGDDQDLRNELGSLLSAFDRHGETVLAVFEDLPLASSATARSSSSMTDSPTLGLTGRRVGPYQIIQKLGEGGMGVVYHAYDTRLGRSVALKFLPRHLNADAEAEARFEREARATSALDHSNICTIHDISETGEGDLYIVMAYYEGQTLKYRLKDGALGPRDAMNIVRQIADGLASAHEAGIVHRDIKPANIMVTDKGRVKILDFGIAKLTGGMDLTRTGGTVGTVYYMSPEQIRGEHLDHRTDLWSLGVVMYQMLTGRRPFEGEYRQAVTYSILNEEPAAPPSDVPESLAAVCIKLLAKEPDERYQSASEVLQDLGVTSHRVHRKRRSSWTNRSVGQRLTLVAAAIAIVTTILLLVISQMPRSANDAASANGAPLSEVSANRIAIMPFSVGGGGDLAYLDERMVELLIAGLQGMDSLQTVDPDSLLAFLGDDRSPVRDPHRGSRIASHFGAGRFVLGSVTKLGPEFRINASLYSAEGALLHQVEVRAPTGNRLPEIVDTLAVQLVAGQ